MLVIDDEPAILRSTKLLLELQGDTCACASNPAEGFAAAEERRPDVILQDVQIPGMDIVAQVTALRRSPATAGAAIVLFSACIDLDSLAFERGIDHDELLEKPFTLPALLDAIERATERRRSNERAALPNA